MYYLISDIAPSSKDIAEMKKLKDSLLSVVRDGDFKKAQDVQTKIDRLEEKMKSSSKIFQGKSVLSTE